MNNCVDFHIIHSPSPPAPASPAPASSPPAAAAASAGAASAGAASAGAASAAASAGFYKRIGKSSDESKGGFNAIDWKVNPRSPSPIVSMLV